MTPEETPVEEAPVVEPVVDETPVTEEPAPVTIDWESEETRQRAAEALQFHEQYGTRQSEIDRALQIDEALKTEDGITQMFLQAGRALGFTPDELEKALFPQQATQEPVEEEDEDRVLTLREAKELLAKQVLQPAAEAQRQAAENAARSALNDTLESLKVTSDTERRAVLALADAHVEPGDLDPDHIKAAIRKGYEEYTAEARRRAEALIREKVADQERLPGSIGGSTAGGEELPEPQTVEEAKARVRARLRNGQ